MNEMTASQSRFGADTAAQMMSPATAIIRKLPNEPICRFRSDLINQRLAIVTKCFGSKNEPISVSAAHRLLQLNAARPASKGVETSRTKSPPKKIFLFFEIAKPE